MIHCPSGPAESGSILLNAKNAEQLHRDRAAVEHLRETNISLLALTSLQMGIRRQGLQAIVGQCPPQGEVIQTL